MLSIPGANRVEVCNWIFILMNNNELRIKNSENLQVKYFVLKYKVQCIISNYL